MEGEEDYSEDPAEDPSEDYSDLDTRSEGPSEEPSRGSSDGSSDGSSGGQQVATRRIGAWGDSGYVDGRVRRIGQLVSSYPTTKAEAVGKTYNTVPRVWRTVANVRTGQTTSGQVKKNTPKQT